MKIFTLTAQVKKPTKNTVLLVSAPFFTNHEKQVRHLISAESSMISDVDFAINDISKTQDIAEMLQLRSFPSVAFIDKNGIVKDIYIGILSEEGIANKVSELFT